MTLIADLFPKLRTPKNVIRYMSKKKVPFDWKYGKRVQTLFPSEPQHRYVIILKVIDLEKVCFSQKQSLISVC